MQFRFAGTVNGATEMLLVNAVYFNGKWKIPFDPMSTQHNHTFMLGSENYTIQVPMMQLTSKRFRTACFDSLDSCAVEIPYGV